MRELLSVLTKEQILADWSRYREEVLARLAEFRAVREKGDRALLEELAFCILAANSSAEQGMRSAAALRDLLWDGPLEEMQQRIKGHRYWRLRPAYIVHTREFLRRHCGLRFGELLASFPDDTARRNWLAAEPGIKGVGLKEAGHFLRNIGYGDCAILDKHILRCLAELKVVSPRLVPRPARRYLLIERRMRGLAQELGLEMAALDLLLWRHKTGKILK